MRPTAHLGLPRGAPRRDRAVQRDPRTGKRIIINLNSSVNDHITIIIIVNYYLR